MFTKKTSRPRFVQFELDSIHIIKCNDKGMPINENRKKQRKQQDYDDSFQRLLDSKVFREKLTQSPSEPSGEVSEYDTLKLDVEGQITDLTASNIELAANDINASFEYVSGWL